MYKGVMAWPAFRVPVSDAGPVAKGADRVELLWHSSTDAEGLELTLDRPARAVDFRGTYWRRVVFVDAEANETYAHTDASQLSVPPGTQRVRVYALPPDGRDNCPAGYRAEVPVPRIIP